MGIEPGTVLITGALGGIGLGIARDLMARGARVVLTGRQAPADLDLRADFLPLDVTSESDWEGCVAAIIARYGRLDGLVNNAGVLAEATDFEAASLSDWRRTMAVNLDGAFLGCRVAMAAMAKTGGGSIVNISSAAADLVVPEAAAYCVSKAALLTLTRLAAKAGGKFGVRVNAILPGAIETPMLWSNLRPGQDPRDLLDALAAAHPIGRIGQTGDIAGAVAFLLDPANGFITGALLAVDGGQGIG